MRETEEIRHRLVAEKYVLWLSLAVYGKVVFLLCVEISALLTSNPVDYIPRVVDVVIFTAFWSAFMFAKCMEIADTTARIKQLESAEMETRM